MDLNAICILPVVLLQVPKASLCKERGENDTISDSSNPLISRDFDNSDRRLFIRYDAAI